MNVCLSNTNRDDRGPAGRQARPDAARVPGRGLLRCEND